LPVVSNNLNPSTSSSNIAYAVSIDVPIWWHQSILHMFIFNVDYHQNCYKSVYDIRGIAFLMNVVCTFLQGKGRLSEH
jgi:hypothetical protein